MINYTLDFLRYSILRSQKNLEFLLCVGESRPIYCLNSKFLRNFELDSKKISYLIIKCVIVLLYMYFLH